jgi:phosphopantetheine adenylyltransferase
MAKEGAEVLITMAAASVEVMVAATHTITTTIRIQELDTQGTLEELALATDKILIKKEKAQEINSSRRRSTKLSTTTSRKVKRFQI